MKKTVLKIFSLLTSTALALELALQLSQDLVPASTLLPATTPQLEQSPATVLTLTQELQAPTPAAASETEQVPGIAVIQT